MERPSPGEGQADPQRRKRGNNRPLRFGVVTTVRMSDHSAWDAARARGVPVQQFMREAIEDASRLALKYARKSG